MSEPVRATIHSLHIRCLKELITKEQRGCCDLKLEGGEDGQRDRWYLCRLDKGKTDHRVTIEHRDPETGEYSAAYIFTDPEDPI